MNQLQQPDQGSQALRTPLSRKRRAGDDQDECRRAEPSIPSTPTKKRRSVDDNGFRCAPKRPQYTIFPHKDPAGHGNEAITSDLRSMSMRTTGKDFSGDDNEAVIQQCHAGPMENEDDKIVDKSTNELDGRWHGLEGLAVKLTAFRL